MLKTLDRYVIREILPPFVPVAADLHVHPRDPAGHGISRGSWSPRGSRGATAGRILLTLLPQALGLTIPMALLVGLLIGLGRMSGDREAVALLACGVSPYRLLRPILLAGDRGRPASTCTS